jgi:hypothetical protein
MRSMSDRDVLFLQMIAEIEAYVFAITVEGGLRK